jgi:hypothetical protein
MAKMSTGKKVAVGAGIAALAAAGIAGAYLLYGKNGAKNRKKVKSWMLKAQADVLEQLENLQDVSEKTYQDVVAAAVKKYSALHKAAPAEIAALSKELKGQWKHMKSEAMKGAKKAKSAVKKVAKKK